jgi:hypothetical protein
MIHEFVEFIPDNLEEGIIYISTKYKIVSHNCCCGCGNEVVTPLSPTDWKITFDGESISLYPSIGNWNFECKSHYWVKNNNVQWSYKWSEEKIKSGRSYDEKLKKQYYQTIDTNIMENEAEIGLSSDSSNLKTTFWKRIKRLFSK